MKWFVVVSICCLAAWGLMYYAVGGVYSVQVLVYGPLVGAGGSCGGGASAPVVVAAGVEAARREHRALSRYPGHIAASLRAWLLPAALEGEDTASHLASFGINRLWSDVLVDDHSPVKRQLKFMKSMFSCTFTEIDECLGVNMLIDFFFCYVHGQLKSPTCTLSTLIFSVLST